MLSYTHNKVKKLKCSTRLSAIDMLEKKYEKKAALKEKELELRRMELELQQRKWEMEEKERKQRLELDAEERRAFIQLITKDVNL